MDDSKYSPELLGAATVQNSSVKSNPVLISSTRARTSVLHRVPRRASAAKRPRRPTGDQNTPWVLDLGHFQQT